jgi:hypothetical protein
MAPRSFFFIVLLLTAAFPVGAADGPQGDRYVGYYYPPPAAIETYVARARTMADSDRRRRIGFVTALERDLGKRPYAPTITYFVKSGKASKLIIIATSAGRLDTIYRVRALLASLTASARTTPVFRNAKVDDLFTFLDLLKMLGFESVTVSDGDKFAHQVLIK